jgi:type II secretory pathway pseudopilin PulG
VIAGIGARLAQQSGLATPVVVAILAAVGLLAAGGALAALGANDGANEDRRAKRALAAAEAGVQEAAYRLATLRPDQTKCLGVNGTSVDPVGGECPTPVPGAVAADATFAYHATPALPSGASCADQPSLATDPTATDHCITATGTVASVNRRVQARVRVKRSTIFGALGLLGLEFVDLVNSITLESDVGSNGLIDGDNSVQIDGTLRIPDGASTPTISGSSPPVERLASPWALEQIDFAAIANTNGALNGLPGWDSATRELVLGNSVEIPLGAGTYHVCELYADNSVKIALSSSATPSNPVRIYVDSPDRPGSGCAAGTGRFCLDNSVEFNKDGDAADLEIYVYGSAAQCAAGRPGLAFDGAHFPSDSAVVLGNSVHLAGTIYAPTSRVKLNNSVQMQGGVAALSVELANSVGFTHPESVKDKAPAAGPVRRLSWVECRSQPTDAADPESGCA